MGCFKKRENNIKAWVYKSAYYQAVPETEEETEWSEQISIIRLCEHFGWTWEYAEEVHADAFKRMTIYGVWAGDHLLSKRHAQDAKKAR